MCGERYGIKMEQDTTGLVRINRYISETGLCSRREADKLLADKRVKIDGKIADIGAKVKKGQIISVDGKPISKEEKMILIAFHKPRGIVCTTDRNEPDNIIDFINMDKRIYPIGRLDKDSEGLILLTNQGDLVNKILRGSNNHEKEYNVMVNKKLTVDFIEKMSKGVPILDTITKPCEITVMDDYTFRIILTQGMNRQIRRMCEYFSYKVVRLRRVRIMNINLGRLKVGTYRNVTKDELKDLEGRL
jgi:23S rRNA pseudouridine2604 synthase